MVKQVYIINKANYRDIDNPKGKVINLLLYNILDNLYFAYLKNTKYAAQYKIAKLELGINEIEFDTSDIVYIKSFMQKCIKHKDVDADKVDDVGRDGTGADDTGTDDTGAYGIDAGATETKGDDIVPDELIADFTILIKKNSAPSTPKPHDDSQKEKEDDTLIDFSSLL